MAAIVNERYALALYELAQEDGKVAETLDELTVVADAARQAPELLTLLQAPSVPFEDKKKLLQTVFGGKVCDNLLNFLMLITEKGRSGGLLEMQEAYKQRYYNEQGICEVTAVTAIALDEALLKKLIEKLGQITNKKIVLHQKVDASIMGGIILNIGNEQIDTSVKTRLNDLAQKMTQIIA